ncbi:hypothetical protein N7489_008133 [Penicillium chrysogenum]|uniref:Alpha-L-rhamnosidase C n=1 Tax=Penicillium chrysogenum TaxID=5076 RepID=A0ABQ8WAW0_PENCH|nr:uncharacterized protein N7489_008133 [Penicillium chrysogenum]KAJ5238042.1 hypothetical protein N7489_008133 [Penicillium chrysogenum]KAJ5261701.1 hypothetical protein N7505_008568 [Penicillium chrysogenum]KAJ5278346.1 hypothetical protein N7524_004499 [Penicillium chrysogenum]
MEVDSTSTVKLLLSDSQMTVPNNTAETIPKASWQEKAHAFIRWMCTPLGACITIYGLNVVAWGGMLFLLMCNAAPAMCHPTCDSLDSSRRIWIEIDSQILNALFCVTGFGLAPWRIRDLYQWFFWRLGWSGASRRKGFTRLAEIHKNWFLKAQELSVLPIDTQQNYPAAEQATPTPLWKMDVVVWGNILNTVFQICLAVCMWAMNRFDRPSWTTGLFVGLACVVAGVAGIVMWLEKKRVKKASEHPGALLLIPRATEPIIPGGKSGDYTSIKPNL